MDSAHHSLLLNTNVRWLSIGNVSEQVFELIDELKLFYTIQGKMEFLASLNDEQCIVRLAYLLDIFEQLKKLTLQMQGKNTSIMKFLDALKAFMSMLENWKRKVILQYSNVCKMYLRRRTFHLILYI